VSERDRRISGQVIHLLVFSEDIHSVSACSKASNVDPHRDMQFAGSPADGRPRGIARLAQTDGSEWNEVGRQQADGLWNGSGTI